MMKNLIDRIIVKQRALKRLVMWHCFSGSLPLYLVTEFPKSGGTWFAQMLSDYLRVPFYRNAERQRFCSSVMAGHHLYSPRFRNVTVVLRDGRDAMVSAYYHVLFDNDINWNFGVAKHRSRLHFEDLDNIRANLPRFIEYMFVDYPKQGLHCSWSQFIDSWWDKNAHIVRYEDLLSNPVSTLQRAIEQLVDCEINDDEIERTVKKYSFKNISGRDAGDENKHSFVRKGVAGDWKNLFSREACAAFDYFVGEHLIRTGYENNREWIDKASSQQPQLDLSVGTGEDKVTL